MTIETCLYIAIAILLILYYKSQKDLKQMTELAERATKGYSECVEELLDVSQQYMECALAYDLLATEKVNTEYCVSASYDKQFDQIYVSLATRDKSSDIITVLVSEVGNGDEITTKTFV